MENAKRADREAEHAREEKSLSDRRLYVAEMHLAHQAWHDNRPDLAQRRLQEFVPDRPEASDPRGSNGSISSGSARSMPAPRGHTDRVTSVAYSPDGGTLASAGGDGLVILWDLATGRIVHTLHGHSSKAEIDTLVFRPDGRNLVSAGIDGTVRVWTPDRAEHLGPARPHGRGQRAAYRPDGRRIATCGHDDTVRLWDADTGREIRTLRGHTGPVYSLAYSPDGHTLISASVDRTLKLWDAETGRELRTLGGHSGVVRSLAMSPDGSTIASASWDQTVKLWAPPPAGDPHSARAQRAADRRGVRPRREPDRLGRVGRCRAGVGRRDRPGAPDPARACA